MKIIILDLCNYIDYPLGGQTAFVRNMISVFKSDAKLVGISTEKTIPVGKWTKHNINNIEYDYFSVKFLKKEFKRPVIPSRLKSMFYLRPNLKSILKHTDYDYIYVQAPEVLICLPNNILSKVILRMPGVENPLIISRYPIARKLAKMYDLIFMRKASKIKYILASACESEIHKFLKRSKGKITREQIVKYPTRYNSSVYFSKDKVRTRLKLGLSDSTKIITTVGRLAWFKGWKFIIDAFNIILGTNSNTKLFFIGDGEDHTKIEEYIKLLNLQDNVILLGKRLPNEVSNYLNASDVFVMGSYKEGWSTTLVEACACCIPCVTTDFSSASEMIYDGINGYVIKSRSEKEFADKILLASIMDRNNIIRYNDKYKSLAVSRMKESIENIIIEN